MPLSASLRPVIFQNGVLLFCFFLPLWPRLAAGLAAATFLVWLFNASLSRLTRPVALLLPTLFFYYLTGVLYSENSPEGWHILETKLPLLAFPLMLIGSPPEQLQPKRWFMAFVAGCLAAALISLGAAVWFWFSAGESRFFYSKLGELLSFHPAYFSMYLIVALMGIAPYLRRNRRMIVLVGFFLLFIFLLSARMQILILGGLSLAALWAHAFREKTFKTAGIATTAGLALVAGLLILLPVTRQRMLRLFDSDPGQSANLRLQTWDATLHLIGQHPWTGTGTGDFTEDLNAVYLAKGYLAPLEDNLNAHNQYLQTAGTLGIPAALLWVICLAWPIALAWKHKKPMFFWFLLLFLLSNLTESMLQTQRGTMFFGFFYSLYLSELLPAPPKILTNP